MLGSVNLAHADVFGECQSRINRTQLIEKRRIRTFEMSLKYAIFLGRTPAQS